MPHLFDPSKIVDGKSHTKRHLEKVRTWVTKRMPPRASPLLAEGLLFLVNRNGIATCLEPKTGEVIWQERLKGAYSASPIYSKGRIYFFNEDAIYTVIKPSRKLNRDFVAVGENLLGQFNNI